MDAYRCDLPAKVSWRKLVKAKIKGAMQIENASQHSDISTISEVSTAKEDSDDDLVRHLSTQDQPIPKPTDEDIQREENRKREKEQRRNKGWLVFTGKNKRR